MMQRRRKIWILLFISVCLIIGAIAFVSFNNRNKYELILANPGLAKSGKEETYNFSLNQYALDMQIAWVVSTSSAEGITYDGNFTIHIPVSTVIQDRILDVFTKPGYHSSINPYAKTLEDYGKDFSIDKYNDVHIESQKSMILNGTPVLRQIYSVGVWVAGGRGENLAFYANDLKHQVRYIFFDGSEFVVVTTDYGETPVQAGVPELDQLMTTLHRIK